MGNAGREGGGSFPCPHSVLPCTLLPQHRQPRYTTYYAYHPCLREVVGLQGVVAISIAVYLLKMDVRTHWAGSGDMAKGEPVCPSQLFAQVDLIWWRTGGIRAGHHGLFLSCPVWEASACQGDYRRARWMGGEEREG